MGRYAELLAQAQKQPVPQEGYMWFTMLIKFDTNGKAEIVRSFSKPAKDSSIKSVMKPKKENSFKKEEPAKTKELFK